MLKKAHLRRYGALGRTLNVERLRLACGCRAPPRIWTFLSILPLVRSALGACRSNRRSSAGFAGAIGFRFSGGGIAWGAEPPSEFL
jgi:hypothetical protein